jgi:DNA-binding transcriptional MerR regulator
MGLHHMQIGEVAEKTGLSLRTIRYYEEVGLVTPSARSAGGFRLYSEADLSRLLLVRRMKPLDFSLEEMKDLLAARDALEAAQRQTDEHRRSVDRLEMYRELVSARVASLKEQLEVAESFAGDLRREINRQKRKAASRST